MVRYSKSNKASLYYPISASPSKPKLKNKGIMFIVLYELYRLGLAIKISTIDEYMP